MAYITHLQTIKLMYRTKAHLKLLAQHTPKDNTISKIFHNCPPCKSEDCGNYCSEGDMILELQGGTCKQLGIKSGNKIISDLD